MELKILKLAIEKLTDDVEWLKKENAMLKQKLSSIGESKQIEQQNKHEKDEFLSTKQVLKMLGICYNTLQKIMQKGLITPIRINQRRVIFSKRMLLEYLYSKVPSKHKENMM